MNRSRPAALALAVSASVGAIFMAASNECAAQSLPQPSRTVFKCEVAGKVVYSDSPCLGAVKVDVEPTRGADKSTGQPRVGADVQRERQREALAEGIRPVTGMNAKQFEVATRRMKLGSEAQAECRKLDGEIPAAEADESRAMGSDRQVAQARLLKLRQQFRDLRC